MPGLPKETFETNMGLFDANKNQAVDLTEFPLLYGALPILNLLTMCE